VHRTKGGLTASDTVGLVVEYAPATGETRVRFPDGVDESTVDTSQIFLQKSCVLECSNWFRDSRPFFFSQLGGGWGSSKLV
jgi:hypothetical protein